MTSCQDLLCNLYALFHLTEERKIHTFICVVLMRVPSVYMQLFCCWLSIHVLLIMKVFVRANSNHVCICNFFFHFSWGGCVFLSLYILYICSMFTVSVFVLASCRMFSFPCLLCFHTRWSLFLNLQHISFLGHSNVFVNGSHCRYYDHGKCVIILLLYQQLTYLQLIKWV